MNAALSPVVMLGVDAASITLISDNLPRLPNFRRLLELGAYHSLDSWGDLVPGAVWPSFATGSAPGQHGIYNHIQWNPESMRLQRVTSDWLGYRPFWRDLAATGRKVCVVDVPMTFATHQDNALEIVSWASHDQLIPFHCNRADVEGELRRRFQINPMGSEIPVAKSAKTLHAVRDRLIASARQKGKLTQWLLGLDNWDLFISVFGETHRGGHLLWSGDEARGEEPSVALLEIYEAVDASLGLVCNALDKMPGSTLVLFAVHGMRRDISRAGVVPFVMDRVNQLHNTGAPAVESSPRQRSLMRYLRRVLPAHAQHAIGQLVPVHIRDWVVQQAVAGGHDWSLTPGFALLADLSGYIRLNSKGRETRGMLEPGSHQERRYVTMIKDSFRELVDVSTGDKIVADVRLRSSVFQGPRAELLPDLLVSWNDTQSSRKARSQRLGLMPTEPSTGRSGNHARDGFGLIVSASPDFRQSLTRITDFRSWLYSRMGVGAI